ncbi:hypothetical protein FACS1894208_02130 [Clostridia bacterium]|nr:hypothetical protein FACS1894208_02130 [Clostridia bacterium]
MDAMTNAVIQLNSKGAKTSALAAYRTLEAFSTTPSARTVALGRLSRTGRVWYTVAGVQDFILKAELQSNFVGANFGGVRVLCALPAKGTHYLIAVDVGVDVNGGTVVSQWVTRKPVSAQNIPTLLSLKNKTLLESELNGDYFERYSEINAVTNGVRRTPDGMVRTVLQRLTEKMRQTRV